MNEDLNQPSRVFGGGASKLAQSVNFKYCSMVCLAVCGRPLVEGILAVYFGLLVLLYT